jgi:hypothetical protein
MKQQIKFLICGENIKGTFHSNEQTHMMKQFQSVTALLLIALSVPSARSR